MQWCSWVWRWCSLKCGRAEPGYELSADITLALSHATAHLDYVNYVTISLDCHHEPGRGIIFTQINFGVANIPTEKKWKTLNIKCIQDVPQKVVNKMTIAIVLDNSECLVYYVIVSSWLWPSQVAEHLKYLISILCRPLRVFSIPLHNWIQN